MATYKVLALTNTPRGVASQVIDGPHYGLAFQQGEALVDADSLMGNHALRNVICHNRWQVIDKDSGEAVDVRDKTQLGVQEALTKRNTEARALALAQKDPALMRLIMENTLAGNSHATKSKGKGKASGASPDSETDEEVS